MVQAHHIFWDVLLSIGLKIQAVISSFEIVIVEDEPGSSMYFINAGGSALCGTSVIESPLLLAHTVTASGCDSLFVCWEQQQCRCSVVCPSSPRALVVPSLARLPSCTPSGSRSPSGPTRTATFTRSPKPISNRYARSGVLLQYLLVS